MITMITGTPGSGKSLKAAYQLLDQLNSGKYVITNYDLNFHNYRNKYKKGHLHTFIDDDDMTVDKLVKFAVEHNCLGKEHSIKLYLDEPDFFNPRDFARSDRRGWISFMRLHRKLGYDVYLITQDEILIDKQMRKFVEVERRCRDVGRYGMFGKVLSLLCGGRLFIYNDLWYGSRPKLKLDYSFFLLNKRKASIYDSMNLFGSYEDIMQAFGRAGAAEGDAERFDSEAPASAASADESPCSDVSV